MIQCEVCHWTAVAADVATVVGVIVAIVAGYIAYTNWKKQLIGTAEYELALRVLKAVYTLRESIYLFKKPVKRTWEELDELYAEAKLGPPSLEQRKEIEMFIPNPEEEERILDRRFSRIEKAMVDFRVVSIEARVLWKDEAKDMFFGLHSYVVDLTEKFTDYIFALRPLRHLDWDEREGRDTQMWAKHRLIFAAWGEKPSTDKMDALIKNLEDYLSKYLKK